MGTILYTILIKPLELIFELIFSISHDIVPNPAVNLVIMSLAINLLVLPLYRRADIIQAEAKAKEATVRPMADHIKKHFKGDEKVMMLQILYEQKHYHPLSSLKSIISLLLQIPFFIAAYNFLSHLTLLDGQSMGPISDLAKPDGLITIGSISINLLPILMTVINIISSEIYTKGQPFKDKIVLYLSAAIFLVLLYDSPSGLVFYWTFNNVFALVKNLFYKLKNPVSVFKTVCFVSGIVCAVVSIIKMDSVTTGQFAFLLIISAALMIPLIWHFISGKLKVKEGKPLTKWDNAAMILELLYLSVHIGLLTPSATVSSSVEEFILSTQIQDPVHYVILTFATAIGMFIIWGGIYYYLLDAKMKKIASKIGLFLIVVVTSNYFIFNDPEEILSSELILITKQSVPSDVVLLVSLSTLLLAAGLVFICKFLGNKIVYVVTTLVLVISAMSIVNVVSIEHDYKSYGDEFWLTDPVSVPLSRNGKNVIVIMADMATSGIVPYIFAENESLVKQFDGFTYYPNTVSFGSHTFIGAPAIYGGYEYTPERFNERSDMFLVDKHNEALKVLPVLFSNNDFQTSVIDPPLANYVTIPNVSIFREYSNIRASIAEGYMTDGIAAINNRIEYNTVRNFFFYSLMKSLPMILRDSVYNGGKYNALERNDVQFDYPYTFPQKLGAKGKSTGVSSYFINKYSVLVNLSTVTDIVDEGNCFTILANQTPHAQMLLQLPDYTMQENVDNTQYEEFIVSHRIEGAMRVNTDTASQILYYHTSMATYSALGIWFDYLRSCGVWDNTRIIIVADHGNDSGYFDELNYAEIEADVELVNPVLMVKDFNSQGFSTSDAFMTCADVPTLAVTGLIDNPVNPFTGNQISSADKEGPQHVAIWHNWSVETDDGFTFVKEPWYSVHDNIFDRNNWEYLGEY